MRGLPVISYGWGRGHIRVNNEAFARFGLAEVAPTAAGWRRRSERALARPRRRIARSRRCRAPPRTC